MEDRISRRILGALNRQRAESIQNNPPLPQGTDPVTIDQHLPHSTVQDIFSDQYVELSSLTPGHIFCDEQEYKLVVDSNGRTSYKAVKKTREIDNIFKYLANMFIFGACYLRHRPQQGPEFLQYLYHILDDNKNYKWPAVAEYDRDFRYFRQNNPTFSWATINTTFHNTLNKVFNQRAVANSSLFDQENRRQGHGNRHYGQNSQGGHQGRGRDQSSEPYGCFNMGTCRGPCKYAHICAYCKKAGHTEANCQKKRRDNWHR